MTSIYTSGVPLQSGLILYESGKPAAHVWPLTLGETVEAIIGAEIGPSRFLLTIKNDSLPVSSELPLYQGQKLTVRVDQLQPTVVLRIVKPDDLTTEILHDYTLFNRSNPDSLRNLFVLSNEIFANNPFLETLPEGTKGIIENIVNIIHSSVISASSTNKLFLNEFISNLGLLLEWDLLQVLQNKKNLRDVKSEGLKGLFVKLLGELQVIRQRENSKENIRNLTQLIDFTEKSIKTIEGHQILNLQSAIKNEGYFFQIPILLRNEVSTADIFINTQKEGNGSNNKKRSHVLIFLGLDALGDMMIDASLVGNSMGCAFKFADLSAKEFFSSVIGELENRIKEVGFENVFLNCLFDNSIEKRKGDCFREFFPDRDAVNFFV